MRSILQLKRVQTGKTNKSPPTNSSQGAKQNLTVDFRKFFNRAQKTQTLHFSSNIKKKCSFCPSKTRFRMKKIQKVSKKIKKGVDTGT